MRRFLGASGAERHGLAAEGGVGWKLTSTPGGKPGRGGGLSFTATPHLSSQGADPKKCGVAFSLHTADTHTHAPPPSGTPPPVHAHRRR